MNIMGVCDTFIIIVWMGVGSGRDNNPSGCKHFKIRMTLRYGENTFEEVLSHHILNRRIVVEPIVDIAVHVKTTAFRSYQAGSFRQNQPIPAVARTISLILVQFPKLAKFITFGLIDDRALTTFSVGDTRYATVKLVLWWRIAASSFFIVLYNQRIQLISYEQMDKL